MTREIKFRAWDKEQNNMWHWENLIDKQCTYLNSKYFVAMQFTGIQDKNGKDIYEGDKVIGTDPHGNTDRGVVDYETSEAAFVYRFTSPETWGRFKTDYETYEVIGNIYENPELL